MEENILEAGSIIKCMEKASSLSKMEENTLEITLKIKNMDKEHSNGKDF